MEASYFMQTVGSQGLIRKVELVRIIIQSLYDLGYQRAACFLEEESGVGLEEPVVVSLRERVLEGKWDESIGMVHRIAGSSTTVRDSACFLILQQRFKECLAQDNVTEALEIIQGQISKLDIQKDKVEKLARLFSGMSEESGSKFRGAGINGSRKMLLENLRYTFPDWVMMHESRLVYLVEQALLHQVDNCIYHNPPLNIVCLYSDHQCGEEKLPCVTSQILHQHENEVWLVQFSHKGDYLASCSRDCTAIIWTVSETGSFSVKHILKDHQKPVSLVAWSPDDKMVLTCGASEVVHVWEVQTGKCVLTLGKGSMGVVSAAWFPDSQRVVYGIADNSVRFFNVQIRRELSAWRGARMPKIFDLSVTPDGKYMVSICDEKDIRIFHLETKTERVISEKRAILSLCVSRYGNLILVTLTDNEIHMWDIDGTIVEPVIYSGHKHGQYVIRTCFGGSSDTFIATGSEDSQVYIWHQMTGLIVKVLKGHGGMVNCVSWNPANPYMMASASDDCTVRIWRSSASIVRS